MREFLLACAVAAVFGFCYFLMKKLDLFLKENCQRTPEASVLRIAFETPAEAVLAADFLEQLSVEHPGCGLCIFYASADEIRRMLEEREIDFGFLAGDAAAVPGRSG